MMLHSAKAMECANSARSGHKGASREVPFELACHGKPTKPRRIFLDAPSRTHNQSRKNQRMLVGPWELLQLGSPSGGLEPREYHCGQPFVHFSSFAYKRPPPPSLVTVVLPVRSPFEQFPWSRVRSRYLARTILQCPPSRGLELHAQVVISR